MCFKIFCDVTSEKSSTRVEKKWEFTIRTKRGSVVGVKLLGEGV